MSTWCSLKSRASSLTPGFRPGSEETVAMPWNTVWVMGELLPDVCCDPRQILLVVRRDIEPASPFDGSRDPVIGTERGDRLREPNEIAQLRVGTIAHEDMNVIGESCAG